MSTVAFATLGCRLNQVDSQDLAARLEARGIRTVGLDHRSRVDIVVVNTCTVTSRADVSDRQMIRRAIRRHPGARVVVTGCWAQTDPRAVAVLPGVDAVVGNADKPRLPEIIAELLDTTEGRGRGWPWARRGGSRSQAMSGVAIRRLQTADVRATHPGAPTATPDLARPLTQVHIEVSDIREVKTMPAPAAPAAPARGTARSRAFLKVQDGCQHRCAFCIVPLARGVSRSLDPKVVVDHARELVRLGHPEIVLTGVDLGHYGADLLPRTSLAALVQALGDVPGLRWVRLSSVLPAYFTPELIDVVTGSPIVAPHFHIPLQSGSDRVLRRMRRPYNVAMYGRLVERLAERLPGLGLGADVIVGFPGETDEDFAATMSLVAALPFSYLHVFSYSDRKGTEAAGLRERACAADSAARSRALRALADDKGLAFRRAMVDTAQEVLVLERRDRASGRLVGLTGNYVEVTFAGADSWMRTMTTVTIRSADASGTRGEMSLA